MGGKGAKEVESTANVGRQGENQHTNRDDRKRRSKTDIEVQAELEGEPGATVSKKPREKSLEKKGVDANRLWQLPNSIHSKALSPPHPTFEQSVSYNWRHFIVNWW